jgi:hypothetical protein
VEEALQVQVVQDGMRGLRNHTYVVSLTCGVCNVRNVVSIYETRQLRLDRLGMENLRMSTPPWPTKIYACRGNFPLVHVRTRL